MSCELCDPIASAITEFKSCSLQSALDTHLWLYEYQDARKFLSSAKYQGQYRHYGHHAVLLAQAIKSCLGPNTQNTIITYVPTLRTHIKSRGFDHTKILARMVSRYLNKHCAQLLIPAHKNSQASSDFSLRKHNPHFFCRTHIDNRLVVLIDDTATTRTTLENAARALKNVGASQVFGATLAYRTFKGKRLFNDLAHLAQRV